MGEKIEATKWLLWVVFAIVLISAVSWALWPASKIVERTVLENSFQYSEGKKTEIAIFQSTLDEIDAQILSSTDPQMKRNLEAQRTTVSAQLNAAKRR
jgi:hypothetical protein